MQETIKLDLGQKLLDKLDNIMGQIGGYPMGDWETKLGIPERELDSVRKRLKEVVEASTPVDENTESINHFSKNDILLILRSVSFVLAEIPQWEFSTILGFEKTEAEDIYAMINKRLGEFK